MSDALLFQIKIISIGYDFEYLILTIVFNKGIVKRYCSISNITYQEFLDSADHNKNLKNVAVSIAQSGK